MTDFMKIQSLADPFDITISQVHSQIMRAASDDIQVTVNIPVEMAITLTSHVLELREGVRKILRDEEVSREVRDRLAALLEVSE